MPLPREEQMFSDDFWKHKFPEYKRPLHLSDQSLLDEYHSPYRFVTTLCYDNGLMWNVYRGHIANR